MDSNVLDTRQSTETRCVRELGDSPRWVEVGGNRFAYFPFSNVNATHSVSGSRRDGGRMMNVKSNEYNVLEL